MSVRGEGAFSTAVGMASPKVPFESGHGGAWSRQETHSWWVKSREKCAWPEPEARRAGGQQGYLPRGCEQRRGLMAGSVLVGAPTRTGLSRGEKSPI